MNPAVAMGWFFKLCTVAIARAEGLILGHSCTVLNALLLIQ